MPSSVPLFINGKKIYSSSEDSLEVINPATQDVLAHVPLATHNEINSAVQAAKNAFIDWQRVPAMKRARLMSSYQILLKEKQKKIAELLSQETGKIFDDAMGDVWRGIEVVEQASNITSHLLGQSLPNITKDIETINYYCPLGVCLGITPFNFPAMIPLWMFPLAIACGNTFILKPSEQDPLTSIALAELFSEAGAPDGLLQIIHGQRTQAEQLIIHPDVQAVSFVGSVNGARSVYRLASQHLKRAQCFGGAKNHAVIMPDANKDHVIRQLIGSSVGAAGQRCMAISVAVFVGAAHTWIDDLRHALKKITPGPWDDPTASYGPLISAAAKERVLRFIQEGKQAGATCLVDGSHCNVASYSAGHWVGPTLFTGVTPDMSLYKEEIFGPVLCCMHVDTLKEAIALVNDHPCGNGTALFTSSGAASAYYRDHINVGMVGINIPIPVPVPLFSFTGWKDSFYGDSHAYGKEMVHFFTRRKTVTTRWFHDDTAQKHANMTIKLE